MLDKRIGVVLEHGTQDPIMTIGGRVLRSAPTQRTGLGEGYFCVIDDPRPANWQEILEELRALIQPQRKAKREPERDEQSDS